MAQYCTLAVAALEEEHNTATHLHTEDLIMIQATSLPAVTYLIRFTQLAVNVTLTKMEYGNILPMLQ